MDYKIKVWATTEYMSSENSNTATWKFIASLEWKKVFIHKIDENDENIVWISQYEKTQQFRVPIFTLEEFIEENDIDIIKEETEPLKLNYLSRFFEENKKILIWVWIWLFFSVWILQININYSKANILENQPKEESIFETLDKKDLLKNQKINFELEKQKKLREEIRESIKVVETLQKEKEEIQKQKIELAQ